MAWVNFLSSLIKPLNDHDLVIGITLLECNVTVKHCKISGLFSSEHALTYLKLKMNISFLLGDDNHELIFLNVIV
jgi:hypothetical protein